jgi:cytochrome c biogenesis protein ResB
MMTLLETLFDRSNYPKVAFQDNTVAERSLSDGKSSFSCVLARTHDVSLKSVAEVVKKEGIQVRRAETSEMKADVFTKAFGSLAKWKQAVDHIGLIKMP